MHNRSTIDAISIVRRAIELVEPRKHQVLHLVFIDWEKAFDRVHPDAIPYALRRFGVSEHFVGIAKTLLASPEFRVDMDGSKGGWRPQSSEIRQGCTLSPFLFVLVLA
eukprot:8534453-Alexandrium_andersonii.AAC.1